MVTALPNQLGLPVSLEAALASALTPVQRTAEGERQLDELAELFPASLERRQRDWPEGPSAITQVELPPCESPEKVGEFRSSLYRLREAGRKVQPEERQRSCGRDRLGSSVRLMRRPDGTGTAAPGSLSTCSSVWACPVCSATIRANRADELQRGAARWRELGGELYLLTLTVRHQGWDAFEPMKDGVANAWRKVQAGAPWKRFQARHGIAGVTRALEATHSNRGHGWHPHLHVLLWCEAPLAELEHARGWLAERWAAKVETVMGLEHVPNEHGCDLQITSERGSEYLSKLGLEVAGALTKQGRGGRQPFEILQGAIEGAEGDRELWTEYVLTTKRARMLTWSKGMRERLELGDEDEAEHGEVTGAVPARVWDWHVHGGRVLRLFAAAALGAVGLVRYVEHTHGAELALETAMLSRNAVAGRAPPDAAERARARDLAAFERTKAKPAEVRAARRALERVPVGELERARRSALAELVRRRELKAHPILGQRLRDDDVVDDELLAELAELRRAERARAEMLHPAEFSDAQEDIPY